MNIAFPAQVALFQPQVKVDVVRYHQWRREYNQTHKYKLPCNLFEEDCTFDTGLRKTVNGETFIKVYWMTKPLKKAPTKTERYEAWIPVSCIVPPSSATSGDIQWRMMSQMRKAPKRTTFRVSEEEAEIARALIRDNDYPLTVVIASKSA